MRTNNQIVRQPVAIGRFYPQNEDQLAALVPTYLKQGVRAAHKPWAFMLPHAGYVYCGDVIGKTLGTCPLPDTILILCPNHTGRGHPLAVWPDGSWKMPMGNFPIDTDVVELLTARGLFAKDYLAHQNEHSIEVLLPFLYYAKQAKLSKIVAICLGVHDPKVLKACAAELALVLKNLHSQGREIGLIVSSDMNHYEDHETTLAKDDLALQCIKKTDPDALLKVCAEKHITMCGVGPCALCLYLAGFMGAVQAEIVVHTTSGPVSGNLRQTVGYAGIRFYPQQAESAAR